MSIRRTRFGRARGALVLGQGAAAKAFLVTAVAREQPSCGRKRLAISGPVRFHLDTEQYLANTVPPSVDGVVACLGLRGRPAFEISLVTGAMAASAGAGVTVTGRSIGAAVWCAVLSARLQLVTREDAVIVGEVATDRERLLPVSSLEAKLTAACACPGVQTFICPPLDEDLSLRALAPSLLEDMHAASCRAKQRLAVVTVADVEELLRAAYSEDTIVDGALRAGFFKQPAVQPHQDTAVERAAAYLAADNLRRFWTVVENALLDRDPKAVRHWLRMFGRHSAKERRYPPGIGRTSLQLIASLPLPELRLAGMFPLMDRETCLELQRLAGPDDYEDVQLLHLANDGRTAEAALDCTNKTILRPPRDVLQPILDELTSERLSLWIGLRVDTARAKYVLPAVLVHSPAAFEDAISAFYLFLLRHLGSDPEPTNDQYRAAACALVDRAFARDGGIRGARAEARYGTRGGGLRSVLDRMSAQLKQEMIADRVKRVYELTINSRPWKERLAIAEAFKCRLKENALIDSEELPAESMVEDLPQLLSDYVYALQHVTETLRRR